MERDPDGRGTKGELEEVEKAESIIRIYYMKESKSIFNKRKNKNRFLDHIHIY